VNPPLDDGLTDLLERWADGMRLTGAQAEEIRASIVRGPHSGLDPVWWQDLMGRVNGMALQVATMPEAARSAMRQALLAPAPAR